MSLADCLGKIKLSKDVIAEINKDVKKFLKKGMSQTEAEQSAIEKQIEKTTNEVEHVRSQLQGDFAPVEFKIDESKIGDYKVKTKDGKEFYQSMGNGQLNVLSFNSGSIDMSGFLQGKTNYLKDNHDLTEYFKKLGSIARSSKLLNTNSETFKKTVSYLTRLKSKPWAIGKMGFKNQKDAIIANSIVINNIDEIYKTAVSFKDGPVADRKERDNGGWIYKYAMVSIDGKANLVKFRSKNVLVRDRLGTTERETFYFENVLGEVGTQEAILAFKNGSKVGAQSAATPNSIPDSMITKFEKIVNAAQENSPFWQSNQSTKQGSVEFRNDGTTIIRLFNLDNQSTFMHEMGHIYLEGLFNRAMSGDGTAKEIEQMWKIQQWLGYDGQTQTKLTEDQHEQFARGFEAYLMEGKAPSKELQSSFRKFRKWLVSWYKNVSSLNVNITPQIREVFDSMLTTEKSIKSVQAESGILLSDLEQTMGEELTDKVKEKLTELKDLAEEKAFARLFKDQLKLQGEEYNKLLESKRKELKAKYTDELSRSELGVKHNDQKDVLGVRDIKKFAEKIINGSLTEEQKIKSEMDAESLGYSSADHMAKDIMAQKPISQMVDEMVSRDIQEIQSAKDPAAIREQAVKRIRNEHSLELLALEKEILFNMAQKENESELNKISDAMAKDDIKLIQEWLIAKAVNKTTKAFNDKLSKQKNQFEKEVTHLQERAKEREQNQKQRDLARRWIESKDTNDKKRIEADFRESVKNLKREVGNYSRNEADRIRDNAKSFLAKKQYKDAIKFTKYFTGEKNAALRLSKAIESGDWQAALQAKHEQLFNHALAMESIKLSRKVTKTEKFLNDMRKLRKDLWKHEDHWIQASKILDRFGYTRSDFDQELESGNLKEWADKYDAGLGRVIISEWLFNESIRLDKSAMTTEQLFDISDAVKNIRQVANMDDTAFKIENGANLTILKQKLLAESQENIPLNKRDKQKIYDSNNGVIQDAVSTTNKTVSKFFNAHKNIETLLAPLGGFKDGSLWRSVVHKAVYFAANEETKLMEGIEKKLKENFALYDKKELKKFKTERKFISQFQDSLSKETLISMALNLGNESNKEKLISTPPVGFNPDLWHEANIMQALQENLTEKDWQFVQGTWDLIDSYWGDIKALNTRVTGFAPEKVKGTPFQVKAGDKFIELKGGYYPLKQDSRSSRLAMSREVGDTPLYSESNPSFIATTKKGHTKARTNATYPIKLEYGVVFEHLSNVAHDLAFRETVIDLRRVLSDKSIESDMNSAIGRDAYDMTMQYLASVAARDPDQVPPGDMMTSLLRTFRRNTTSYMLALKVSQVTQNLSNVLLYAGTVEGFTQKDVLSGLVKSLPLYMQSFKEGKNVLQDFVVSKSAFMRDRGANPEFLLKEISDKHFGEGSKIAEWSQMTMAFTDNLTANAVWAEAFHKKIGEGSKEIDAIEYADTIIRRSIGSGRRYDQAAMLRSGEVVKLFTMFSSFMNVQYNRISRENGMMLKNKDIAKYTSAMAAQIIFAVLSSVMSWKFYKEDDDEEKKTQWLAQQLTDYAFGMSVAGRYLAPLVFDRIFYDKPANFRVSPAFEIGESVKNTSNILLSDAQAKDKVEAASKTMALATGTPSQFHSLFWNGVDMANGMEPVFSDGVRRRPKKER